MLSEFLLTYHSRPTSFKTTRFCNNHKMAHVNPPDRITFKGRIQHYRETQVQKSVHGISKFLRNFYQKIPIFLENFRFFRGFWQFLHVFMHFSQKICKKSMFFGKKRGKFLKKLEIPCTPILDLSFTVRCKFIVAYIILIYGFKVKFSFIIGSLIIFDFVGI